jgi:hypothetical protein
VEIPDSVLMEDNSNVEKAEAYMKELENVSYLNIFFIYRLYHKLTNKNYSIYWISKSSEK